MSESLTFEGLIADIKKELAEMRAIKTYPDGTFGKFQTLEMMMEGSGQTVRDNINEILENNRTALGNL